MVERIPVNVSSIGIDGIKIIWQSYVRFVTTAEKFLKYEFRLYTDDISV